MYSVSGSTSIKPDPIEALEGEYFKKLLPSTGYLIPSAWACVGLSITVNKFSFQAGLILSFQPSGYLLEP